MGELADSSLTARRLASARRLVLGAPAYFERHGEPATPAELIGHEAVVYTQVDQTWRIKRPIEVTAPPSFFLTIGRKSAPGANRHRHIASGINNFWFKFVAAKRGIFSAQQQLAAWQWRPAVEPSFSVRC